MIGGVVAAGGAYYQSEQAKNAADKSAKGAGAGIDEQRRQFDLIMGLLQPQRDIGNQSINTLQRLYGYAPSNPAMGGGGGSYGGAYDPNAPKPPPGYGQQQASAKGGKFDITGTTDAINSVRSLFGFGGSRKKNKKKAAAAAAAQTAANAKYESDLAAYNQQQSTKFAADQAAMPHGLDVFQASPDYQFRRAEGRRNEENSFAAHGGALSGNALRGITDYNSNLASGEFNNFVQRQLQMAGLGGAATSQGVDAAQYTGSNVSNLLNQQGNARASGVVDSTNALVGGANDIAQGYGNWLGRRNNQGIKYNPYDRYDPYASTNTVRYA